MATMHIPNSVVPAFAAGRFDRDAVFEDFAAKFGIPVTELRFHDEIENLNNCMHTETRLQNYNFVAPQTGNVDVWGFQELQYSFTLCTAGGCAGSFSHVK